MGRWIGLRQSRRAGAPRAWRRDAGQLLDRPADVSGRLGRVPRPAATRSKWPMRPGASTWKARWRSSPTTCRWAPPPAEAGDTIRLVMLVNDVSLRNLIPAELAKGFGFFHGKPSTAFSPVAVTPDELGTAWHGGKVHLPLLASINGKPLGRPECRARHDVLVPRPDRACRPHAAARRRLHHRLGHRLQQGRRRARQAGRPGRRRLHLPRRGAHRGDHPRGQADDAVPAVRRPRQDRDAGCAPAARSSAPSSRRWCATPRSSRESRLAARSAAGRTGSARRRLASRRAPQSRHGRRDAAGRTTAAGSARAPAPRR